jgi:hypothetical protein
MRPFRYLPSCAAAAGLLCCGLLQNGQAQNTTHWGDILFQHVANSGGGGFNFNNGPIIPGTWDDFADFGDLAFQAQFNNGNSFNTVPSWNGSSTIQPFGPPPNNTETYGQTFIAPAGSTKLTSFTFYINDNGDGANFPYQGLVTDWSGSLVGGASHAAPNNILFAGAVETYVGDGTFQAITINIPDGGLDMTAGNAYFLGLTSEPGSQVLPPIGPGASPDAGSSMLLLGLGLSGIAAMRRWFSAV